MDAQPSPTWNAALAEYLAGRYDAARQILRATSHPTPQEKTLLALCQVRIILTAWTVDEKPDRVALRAALKHELDFDLLEADRRFALGWLHWLAGEPDQAEADFAASLARRRTLNFAIDGGESAYWLARVRLRLRRADALQGYEQVLRSQGGTPQATLWLIDLLVRAGNPERADQVWNAVRGNRKLTGLDKAPLVEARLLLAQAKAARAGELLEAARPGGGVALVERDLLLAWVYEHLGRPGEAALLLERAAAGPYPADAVRTWRRLFEARTAGRPVPGETLAGSVASPAGIAFLRGQQARRGGDAADAAQALQQAQAAPAWRPYARYALADLGQEDFAAVLAGHPGWFLARRCRARQVMERFRRRAAGAAELLDALDRAAATGYRGPAAEHFRALADALRSSDAEAVRPLFDAAAAGPPAVRRNCVRVAVEIAAGHLVPLPALPTLLACAQHLDRVQDQALRRRVGEQVLLRVLSAADALATKAEGRAFLATALDGARDVLGPDDLGVRLAGAWLTALGALRGPAPGEPTFFPFLVVEPSGPEATERTLAALWQAALDLRGAPAAAQLERIRQALSRLSQAPRWQGASQVLLVLEAARRHDLAEVGRLLVSEPWKSSPSAQPELLAGVLGTVLNDARAGLALRPSLKRWLDHWRHLDPAAGWLRDLAVQAGVILPDPSAAPVPPEAPPVPWLLHQGRRALSQEDYVAARAWVRRALDLDPQLFDMEGTGPLLQAALGELDLLARARHFARALRWKLRPTN